jgi:uncharacterized protein
MSEGSLVDIMKERKAALEKPQAKRLHEVIAALKTACLRKQAVNQADIPGFDPSKVETVDPDLAANLKKLDVLNKARSRIRARKRRKAAPPLGEEIKQAAEFINPFPGMEPEEKFGNRELSRSLRVAIAAEHEAVHLYEAIADATSNAKAKEVLQDIANEEKVHVGELQELLEGIRKDEREFLDEGREEAKS